MTIRMNTVEYCFDPMGVGVSLARATRFDFNEITLTIPELASRSFVSVFVEVNMREFTSATPAAINARTIGIKLGAAAFADTAVSSAIVHSGENVTYHFNQDVTAYFDTNFGANDTQTCQVGFLYGSANTVAMNLLTAKLVITYAYDDASNAAVRVKTVRIPLESNVGNLTASLVEIGTNQVPALDTFLPEAGKVYKSIFFEMSANSRTINTTDFNLAVALDGETEVAMPTVEQGAACATYDVYYWRRNDIDTSIVHAFKARSSTTGRYPSLSVIMYVTYTYVEADTTRVLNSIVFPLRISGAMNNGASLKDRDWYKVYLPEPGTLTLLQSGVFLNYDIVAEWPNLSCAIGSQAVRTFNNGGGIGALANSGTNSAIRRMDSGAAGGAGISIDATERSIVCTMDCYSNTTATVILNNTVGVAYLNYSSDKDSLGTGVHSKSHKRLMSGYGTCVQGGLTVTSEVLTIPEQQFFVHAGMIVHRLFGTAGHYVTIKAKLAAGEDRGDGYLLVLAESANFFAEVGDHVLLASLLDVMNRYPGDMRKGIDIEASRSWLALAYTSASTTSMKSFMSMVSYHAILLKANGTISNSAGGTVTITLHDAANGKVLASTTRVGNGAYSIDWYDMRKVFVEATEDGTHLGRSADGYCERVV